MPTARHRRLADHLPEPRTLVAILVLVNLEALALALYYLQPDVTLTDPRYAIYGVLWVNVGLWVLVRTDVPDAGRRTRRRALAVAAGYLALLAVTGGLLGRGVPPQYADGLSVVWLPPGWGPAVVYQGTLLKAVLEPAKVLGYLALSYLVYATVVDAAGAAVSGLLGLLSCVSCSWPILASVSTSLLGGGSAIAAAALTYSYDLSTAVFLLTVGLLAWRPLRR